MHPQILYNIDTMDKDRLRNATISLSVRLVQLYDQIERRAFLKNQLARAGTSIGANLFEARYAESPDDFVHKLRIALKECHECEYWLVVLATSCPDLATEAESLRRDAGSIRRMLISSINNKIEHNERGIIRSSRCAERISLTYIVRLNGGHRNSSPREE